MSDSARLFGGASLYTESHSYPSYSQAGEDRILFYLFEMCGAISGLQYLDLGASTPAGHNNTYLFYTCGGNGVLVEADPSYYPSYSIVRPRDTLEPVAIVPERLRDQKTVTFYRMENRGWSTISPEHAKIGLSIGKSKRLPEEIAVPCKTVNEILYSHFTDRIIDIISIDIEGIDAEVLKDIDFDRFRPKTIVVENNRNPLLDQTIHTLSGYTKFASTFVNTIIVRNDFLGRFVA